MSSKPCDIPTHAALDTLGAYLAHLRGDNEQALSQLGTKNDPESLRRRLEILLELDRYSEAAAATRGAEPHVAWCDRGVAALARDGDLAAARAIIAWAHSKADRTTWRRCLLRYADARYQRALERIGPGEPILPGDLHADEAEMLRDALEILRPNLLNVEGQGRVDNEIESLSIQIALHAASLLGEHSRAAAFAKLLTTRTPVPLVLPRFALEHLLTTADDLPERLRRGHPDSFGAKILAVLLEAEHQQHPLAAFEEAKALVPTASTDEDREVLCNVLNEVGQRVGLDALSQVDAIVSALLPKDHRFRRLLAADRLVRRGPLEDARLALEAVRDERDPYWLQLYGNYLLQLGDGRSATDYFARASERYPNPHLLRLAAQVAMDFDRLAIAQGVLERLLSREPDAIPERRGLALAYVRQSLFTQAAEQFGRLRQIEPQDVSHGFNQALSLWRAGHLDESLEAFDTVCATQAPPLRAIIARSELLKTMGRAPEGFNSLLTLRDRFWDDYHYVGAVLSLAYAAQREDIGDQALRQLMHLQRDGKAPADLLQQKTIEDVKLEITKHRERIDVACRLILQNSSPWLFADAITRQPAYWAWTVRTQPLNWIADDPVTRSQYTIYATNGFVVRRADSASTLEPISTAAPGQPVVADLSALITLHRLGLLETALDYFGQFLIPADYVSNAVAELEQLQPHQPSRRVTLEAIKAAVDGRQLSVEPNPGEPGKRSHSYIGEHTLDEEDATEHHYRLLDLLGPVFATGRISDSERKTLAAIAHKGSGVDATHGPLVPGQAILIQLSTLTTLAQFQALRPVLETFAAHLSVADRDEVIRDLNGYAFQDKIRSQHEELWERIRNDPRFLLKPVDVPPNWQRDSQTVEVPFESALLADSASAPLLADDRVLQVIVSNGRSGDPASAFGVDAWLAALYTAGRMNREEFCHKLLQLMEWRYRFIIPAPEMLVYFAAQYVGNPPGQAMLTIARYFHDCMQDPGLLAGFEPTTPPISMGSRLYLSIIGTIAEFIIDLWKDDAIVENVAQSFTEWAIREMLPPPPKNMGAAGDLMAVVRNRAVLSRALFRGCPSPNVVRAHKGIRAIGAALGIEEEEYWKITTEVINGV